MKKIAYLSVLVIVIASSSCKKDNNSSSSTSNTNNKTTVTVNSPPQFTGTINDTAYSLITGTVYSGGNSSSKNIGGSNSTSNTGSYESYMSNTSTGQPFLGITKGTIQFPLNTNFPDTATFDAFFAPGTYAYNSAVVNNGGNGIVIQWLNAKGDVYSTAQGSGDQTGSTFTITAKRAQGLVYGTYEVAVMATFNCKLYSTTGLVLRLPMAPM